MKTTIVCAFAAALALTGAFVVANAAPTTKATVAPAHLGWGPVPTCDPNTSDCGIGG